MPSLKDLRNRIAGEPYADYAFPLVQTYGAQAALVQQLTVNHTLATPRDAEAVREWQTRFGKTLA